MADDFFGISYLNEANRSAASKAEHKSDVKSQQSGTEFIDSMFFPELKSEATSADPSPGVSASNVFEEQYFPDIDRMSPGKSTPENVAAVSDSDDFFTSQIPTSRKQAETSHQQRTITKAVHQEEDFESAEEAPSVKNGIEELKELIDPVWTFSDEVLLNMMMDRVIYDDESLVAFDKPYQMAYSGAKKGQAQLDRLLTRLAQRIAPESKQLHVVRSLDKHCTGIVLFAKNLERHAQLREAYSAGSVEQRYRCIVNGVPNEEKATISIPLVKLLKGKDMRLEPALNPKTSLGVHNGSTQYEVINSNATKCALLGATVSKDVPHQVRAHLAYGTGCTVIGDSKYNIKRRNEPVKISPMALAKLNLQRNDYRRLPMFMHLNQLLIPRGGPGSKFISIRAPVPHFFHFALRKLALLKK